MKKEKKNAIEENDEEEEEEVKEQSEKRQIIRGKFSVQLSIGFSVVCWDNPLM